MGCIPYQTVRDALQSLHRNVVLYKGLPHYVSMINGPPGVCAPDQIRVQLQALPNPDGSRIEEVLLSSNDLDISSMRLGFVNDAYDAHWCSRFPHRGNAQGLVDSNVAVYNITKFGSEARRTFSRLCNLPSFNAQFTNKYPTVHEILKSFEDDKNIRSRAFGLRFAISRDNFRGDYIVHYKSDPVAYGNLTKGELIMSKGYQYLKEQFQEYGFNVVA